MSTVLLDAVISYIMGLSRTNAHISCGMGLLEVLVHRGVKSAGPGRSGGILVTDTEVRLLSDCSIDDISFHSICASPPNNHLRLQIEAFFPSLELSTLNKCACRCCSEVYCIALHCIVLYCISLCCTVFHCTVLYFQMK